MSLEKYEYTENWTKYILQILKQKFILDIWTRNKIQFNWNCNVKIMSYSFN